MNNITKKRENFRPYQYPWAYEAWLKSEQMHWLHTEVAMHEDVRDWQTKLTESEKYFLTQIFRLFTQADLDIAGAYINTYLPLMPQPEIRMMLSSFAAREGIHIAGYAHLIDTLGMPETTFNEFLEYKEMAEKHDYLISRLNRELPIQLAVFSAFAEGLQLFSSFIMLLNFPKNGLMKGMGQIISWSVADEGLHVESMIKVFQTLVNESYFRFDYEFKQKIYTILETMVFLEDKFIDLAFKMGNMRDLTGEQVKSYIRYIADRRLLQLGLDTFYKIKDNPLPWVEEMLNAPTHSNFFETTVTDYTKASLTGSWGDVWAK